MTVTVSRNAGITTFTFEHGGDSLRLDPFIEDWCKFAWMRGNQDPDDWATATNQEKLDELDVNIKRTGKGQANTQSENDAIETAKATADRHDWP